MIEAKILDSSFADEYDSLVRHPMQSWAWGDFKKCFGAEVERLGVFEDNKLIDCMQVVFSKLPKVNLTVGYSGKCSLKYKELIPAMKKAAQKHKAIFIKTEPNVFRKVNIETAVHEDNAEFKKQKKFLTENGGVQGKPLFTQYDFHLDLEPSEDFLMKNFHSKTRYNTRLAKRRGVKVIENPTTKGMENYIRLMKETTARQGFFNHNEAYFLKLMECFPKDRITILEAHYKEHILTAWVLFKFNGKLYYPYGASSNLHRNVMPNNLVMWTAIQYGKKHKCTVFDLWGCLGPNPDENDSWSGFHKFKSGYNPQLVEYIGTYDFVYKPFLYKMFNIADKIRWKILRRRT